MQYQIKHVFTKQINVKQGFDGLLKFHLLMA